MSDKQETNHYAEFLEEAGRDVFCVDGVYWYDYGGFVMPAYLPHCCPYISGRNAAKAVKVSDTHFARWDSEFGQIVKGPWWYVLKKGPWSVDDVRKKKKRWMIRKGKKNFTVRVLSYDEVVEKGPGVAKAAAARYARDTEVESRDSLQKYVQAGEKVPGVLEYIGCFAANKLVSWSENFIQDNAVWLVNIRHDPAHLKKYSSYALMNGILDYYLNEKQMRYVLDGSRNIHHRTQFQEHLMRVFGFCKEYANLHLSYTPGFKRVVQIAYPFCNLIWKLQKKFTSGFMDNVGAVLTQEQIHRKCQSQCRYVDG